MAAKQHMASTAVLSAGVQGNRRRREDHATQESSGVASRTTRGNMGPQEVPPVQMAGRLKTPVVYEVEVGGRSRA